MSSRFIGALKLSVFGINGNVVTSKECTDTVLSIQKHILSKQILKKAFSGKKRFFFPCVCAYKNATLLKYIIKKKKKKPHSAKFRIFWGSQTVQPTIKGWCTKFCWKSFTIFRVIAYVFGPFCKWPILPPKLDFHIILMASLALSPHTHFLYPFPLI